MLMNKVFSKIFDKTPFYRFFSVNIVLMFNVDFLVHFFLKCCCFQ